MTRTSTRLGLLALAGIGLVGLLALVGCQSHPDDKQAVYNAMNTNDLRTVEVFQDRRKGEITLRGIVASEDNKTHAENLAQQAAPGYTIKNELQVQPAGLQSMLQKAQNNAALDSSIEDKFKASLKSNKSLHHEHIEYSADKGTLYLKGSVKSEKERREAEDLANKVPDVKNVVNDLQVKPS